MRPHRAGFCGVSMLRYHKMMPLLILLASFAAGSAHAQTCSSPTGNEADQIYNGDYHTWQFCNGSSWRAFAGAAFKLVSSGSGCTNPTGAETAIVYNYNYHTYQFCNGTTWQAYGPPQAATGAPSGSGYFVLTGNYWNGCMNAAISSITHVGTTATLTTQRNHNLSTGATVVVSAAAPTDYNGTFTITVTGATTFTYTMLTTPASNATAVGDFCSGAGGLSAANANCLTELTANTSWFGHDQASSAGLLVAGHVTAFLCDGITCNNLNASTTYYFASTADVTAGGGSFTTDASGFGPGDNAKWSVANRFGGVIGCGGGSSCRPWTGRAAGSSTKWNGSSNANTCSAWTTASGSGQTGDIGTSNSSRWSTFADSCGYNGTNWAQPLYCLVNP